MAILKLARWLRLRSLGLGMQSTGLRIETVSELVQGNWPLLERLSLSQKGLIRLHQL